MRTAIIAILLAACVGCAPKIEVGQKWDYISKNPFDNSLDQTMTITDIRGDYLQYSYRYHNNATLTNEYRSSESVGLFKYACKRGIYVRHEDAK